MNTLIRHRGKVKNGKLIYYIPELFESNIRELEDREFELVIKEKSKRASTDQFGYYKGGILGTCYKAEMFSHLDNREEIHKQYFAPMFLSYSQMVNIGGKNKEIFHRRSLADLTMKEFSEFISRVIAHCESELGIEIGDSESYYINKYKTIKHG